MNKPYIDKKRYDELSSPFDKAILLCDSPQDLLMLGCIMMTQVKDIFDLYLGEDGRRQMFLSAAESRGAGRE